MEKQESEFFPGVLYEKKEQRENFQSSCKHIKNENAFGKIGKKIKVLGRANQLKSGTNVVQGCSHCRKVGRIVEIVKGYEKDGAEEDQDIYDEEYIGGADNLVRNHLLVHFNLFDRIGMNVKV